MARIERMVTRARVVRSYYELRAAADLAALKAKSYRRGGDSLVTSDEEAEFHAGRHCGMLTALNIISEILAHDDTEAS